MTTRRKKASIVHTTYRTDLGVGSDSWRWHANVGIEPDTSALIGVDEDELARGADRVYPEPIIDGGLLGTD